MSVDAAVLRMGSLPGWFSDPEARLLYRSAVEALTRFPDGKVVEIGSYHGRSTVVLASAVRDARPGASVHAIDPHVGVLSGMRTEPTWDAFRENIRRAGLSDVVVPVRQASAEVVWSGSIALLFIDGLHDLENVTADYGRFAPSVPVGGLIAFHDYTNPNYPGVRSFVDGLVASGELAVHAVTEPAAPENTLIVTRKCPRLSVIIPTCGRPRLAQALESVRANGIRRTDDVIVVGDGPQPAAAEIVSKFQLQSSLPIRYFEHGPTRMVGAAQRRVAMTKATGTHLMFLDDDDEYTAGAIDAVRAEIERHPNNVLIFREESRTPRHGWGVVWKDKEVRRGNVGTQGIVVPNVQGRVGLWPDHYCSDYDFARNTVDLYPDKDAGVIWVERIIAYLY